VASSHLYLAKAAFVDAGSAARRVGHIARLSMVFLHLDVILVVVFGNKTDLNYNHILKKTCFFLVGIRFSRQNALLSSLSGHANDALQDLHYTIGLA